MLSVAVHGAAGHMGRAVVATVAASNDLKVVAAFERPGSSAIGSDAGMLAGVGMLGVNVTEDVAAGLARADVVIDFSFAEAVPPLLDACAKARAPAVVGTTGLDARAEEAIARLAVVAPLVVAPNMSPAVNVLFHLAARATALLGDEYDPEIIEIHHRRKVDAPSGTAVRLYEVVAAARKGIQSAPVHGRSGKPGARRNEEIGVLSLRAGDVVGDHTLVLAGPDERIELTHRAHARSVFARGAVRAARWVASRAPGRYDMTDVLGLND